MLSPEEHRERTRQLAGPESDLRLPDMTAVAIASWLPSGWEQAAIATRGTPRTGVFLYPEGLLVVQFDREADNVHSAVVRYREIEAVEMSHSSYWYFEYQHGGLEGAGLWADDEGPGKATVRFRQPILDLGSEIKFPLPGREQKYPGDWDLIRNLRERILGLASAD